MDMRPPAMPESSAALLTCQADQKARPGRSPQLRPRPPRTSVLAAKLVWLGRRLRRFIVRERFVGNLAFRAPHTEFVSCPQRRGGGLPLHRPQCFPFLFPVIVFPWPWPAGRLYFDRPGPSVVGCA